MHKTSIRAFALLPYFSLLACTTVDRYNDEDEKYTLALAKLDSVITDLSDIQSFVERALSRHEIILEVPRAEIPSLAANNNFKTLPSSLFDLLSSNKLPPNAAAVATAFFNDASNKENIKKLYSSGCKNDYEKTLITNKKYSQKQMSRQLDAVATIKFHQCEGNITPSLNIPKTVLSTDTKAIRSLVDRAKDEALNEPFQIPQEKRKNIIAGQVFRFSSTLDKDIAVARTVSKLIQDQANELANLYKPIARNEFKEFILDRDKIPETSESKQDPRNGWFNALGIDGVIYLSPTFALSAIVSCTEEVKYMSSFRVRLINEARPQLIDRRLTYSDVRNATIIAENMNTKTKKCIRDQLTFLLAHELGHAMIDAREGKSDCLAVSALKLLGISDLGVFGTIILGFLGTENESILGLDKTALDLLIKRKEQINSFRQLNVISMHEALEECSKFSFLS